MLRRISGCLVTEIVVSFFGMTFEGHVWLRLVLRSFATWKAEVAKGLGHLCPSSVSVNSVQTPCFYFAFSGQFVPPSDWSGLWGLSFSLLAIFGWLFWFQVFLSFTVFHCPSNLPPWT